MSAFFTFVKCPCLLKTSTRMLHGFHWAKLVLDPGRTMRKKDIAIIFVGVMGKSLNRIFTRLMSYSTQFYFVLFFVCILFTSLKRKVVPLP